MRVVDFVGRVIRRGNRIYVPVHNHYYLGISLNKHHIKDVAVYVVRNGRFRRIGALLVFETVRGIAASKFLFADSLVSTVIQRISVYNTTVFIHFSGDNRREVTVIPHVFPTSR